MFPRRLSEVTADEVRRLIDLEATESSDLEFKREMPFDVGKGPDPWAQSGKISDYAKEVLASEIVAFANTDGGTLIIGIEEQKSTKKALRIVPLPKCMNAAERLHQSLGSRVDPKLPFFECAGVVTETDGSSGVVIMRTLPSYLMPHRMTSDNHCYVRRNDRSEPMSMVEIQEASRRSGRSAEALERSFAESSERFYKGIPQSFIRTHPWRGVQGEYRSNSATGANSWAGVWALRLCACPLAPLPISNLPNEPWLSALKTETFGGPGRQGALVNLRIEGTDVWIPRLRAVEREIPGNHLKILDRISTDGQIERYVLSNSLEEVRPKYLELSMVELMWNFASTIRMADTIRAECSRPSMHFALEVELAASDQLLICCYPGPTPRGLQYLPAETIKFPRYEIGGRESFDELLTTFDRDVWNVAGHHPDWTLKINWPSSIP